MSMIIAHIQEYGPRFGFFIKPTKGKYLVGERDSFEQIIVSMEYIIEKNGIYQNIIRINPKTYPLGIKDYGAKILGSFIGSN